jgi:hypothetical protein
MKFEDRLAFSATVHALGGYVFAPYEYRESFTGEGSQRFHIIKREAMAEGRASCGRLAASEGSLDSTHEFPQGAELCPDCCVAIIGKKDEGEQSS